MSDEYIRKQDAIDDLHTQLMYRMGSDDMKRRLDDWVKTLPPADVVPVIRCADCALYIASRHWCGFNVAKMYEHDFCSYGKKREE